jgi:esterase/lipase superfamily enzyme
MLFVTNRALAEGPRSLPGRRVHFDLADNEPRASLFFCERVAEQHYVEIGASAFFARLRQSPRRQVLLFVHGFNVQPEPSAFSAARRLQAGLDALLGPEIEVVPVIWPCDDDFGLVLDYFDDQDAAESSGFAFARAIGKFLADRDATNTQCLKHINVLAHSMGNRLLRAALGRWAETRGAVPALFRSIFMVAADVANETLEPGRPGHAITRAARNVVVYHAADDFALRSSKVANVANRVVSRRLGHTGPENPERTPRNVFAVDCDAVNNRYDRLGHTYFLEAPDGSPGAVLQHVAATLATGVPPGFEEGRRSFRLPADFSFGPAVADAV